MTYEIYEVESVTLHLMTDDDQPFGSERSSCERCGIILGYGPGEQPVWTDKREVYENPPEGFVKCIRSSKVPIDSKQPGSQGYY